MRAVASTAVPYNLAVLSMPASALVRRVFIGLLVANLAVVGVKLAVGLSSGSLAVLGGAVDSCVDALNNVLALIVVRVAAKEPDEDHPYGHGKFETLGALAIVGFLSITCFELVREAVNHLVSGTHRVDVSNWQLGLLVLTLGANLLITWYEHRRGTALGSELLVVDAAHTRADVFVTVGVPVCVDRHADVESAHAIADQVEERLKRDLRLHEVTVHVEPC